MKARHPLGALIAALMCAALPARARICTTCNNDMNPPMPQPITVTNKQAIMLGVLPIAVVYAPPGVCSGSSNCPSQKLKSTSSFGTSLTLKSSFQNSMSGKVGVSGEGGFLGNGGKLSVSFETSDKIGSETSDKTQTVIVNVTQLAASLRSTDNFLDFQSTGSKAGDRDTIAFMEFPVFDVVTAVGTATPSGSLADEQKSFLALSPPQTLSVTPNFGSSLRPPCPAGITCFPWTERAVSVEQIRTQLAGGDGGLPELSKDDLNKLLAFDPVASAAVTTAVNDPLGRFVKQPIAYAWTPCDSQIQPDVQKTTTNTSGTTTSLSFSVGVKVSGSVEAGIPGIAKSSLSYEVEDTMTWGYSSNSETTEIQGTDAAAQFGGNGIDTMMCGNPTTTVVYVDTVSGTLLFDTPKPPFQFPANLGDIVACFVNDAGAATANVAFAVIGTDPVSGQQTPTRTVTTDSKGCAALTLDAGAYNFHQAGLPAGAADHPFTVAASTGAVTRLPVVRLGKVTAGQPAALTFDLQPVSSIVAGDMFGLNVRVRVLDEFGSAVASYNGPVSLALAPGTGSAAGKLSGRTTVNARAGIAAFSGLSIAPAAKGYRLIASIPTPPISAVSAPLDVSTPAGVKPTVTPVLSIQSIGGVSVPQGASGAFDPPDVQLPASAGNSAKVRVAVNGLPKTALVHLFVSSKLGDTLLPAVDVGSKIASRGSATFNVTLPTTITGGVPPVVVLQARATQAPAFASTGTLRTFKTPVNSFLASSAPVTVQAAATSAPGPKDIAIVQVGTAFPPASASPLVQLPPGTSTGNVPVVLALGSQVTDGTSIALIDQNGKVLSSGVADGGVARLVVPLPAPPATGTVPVTTLEGIAGMMARVGTGKVQVSILRGFVDSVQATPFAGGLTISWTTDPASASVLQLTDPDGKTIEVADAQQSTIHQVSLTNLKPSTLFQIHITASHPPLDPWTGDTEALSGPRPGDLTGDGAINIGDALAALRIAVGLDDPTEDQLLAGDLEEVGKITVPDVVQILQTIVAL